MTEVLEILLWVSAAAWIVLFVQGVINRILVRNLSRIDAPEPESWPLVSYVVPARNEERGIERAVTSFCNQDYPNFEVVVVDDRSTDSTPHILDELQAKYDNLTVVQGQEPPPGWLGKPNALETGRKQAKGEWILMVDADAVHAPDLLRRGMAYALKEEAGMLVVRPRHLTESVMEAVLMSSINFFFFVATPLFLVRYSRSRRFATGSPVFNLIRTEAMEKCRAFACIKDAVVDDLAIGFCVKGAGYRMATAFAGSLIGHRMYRGAAETVRGFAKTTYPPIRNLPWLLPLYVVVATVVSFLPYYGFVAGLVVGEPSLPATISLALMHVVFAGLAWQYQERWYITFLNPIRELGWLWIFIRSFFLYQRKGLVWRGRSYPAST